MANAVLAKRLQETISMLEASTAAGQKHVSALQVRACSSTPSCSVAFASNQVPCLTRDESLVS